MGRKPAYSDEEFITLFEQYGATETAKRLGVNLRSLNRRRGSVEARIKRQLIAPIRRSSNRVGVEHPQRVQIEITDGVVLVGSDAHILPGIRSTAMRALVKFCKDLSPRAVIQNGDVVDLAAVSRFSPSSWTNWESRPTVKDEIESAKDQLHDIEQATPRGCVHAWTLGNHDGRFETRLATVAPEYAKIAGFHLKDHFPAWEACWSVWINGDVVIKHRFKGGVHAIYNNPLHAGTHIITGHLHSLNVRAHTDYNGTRFGVDTGCLADTNSRAFLDYTEDNPLPWSSGFIVLTFRNGRLMWPEPVHVIDKDMVEFRGDIIKV